MIDTVQSGRYGLLSNATTCHACRLVTPVSAICIVGGRYRHDPDDDDWYQVDGCALLSYVQRLDATALDAWRLTAPWIKYMPSRTAEISYWSNTCVHCGALQGDWFLSQPDGPFFPTTPDHEASMTLTWAAGGLIGIADVSESSWLDRLVARSP